MIEFSATSDMAAAANDIWRIMTDADREPDWMAAVRRAEFIGAARSYSVGAQMRRTGKFLWIDLAWTSEIVACEPARRVQFRHSGAIRGESSWEIATLPAGCRVRLWSSGPAPGPLRWLPALAACGGRLGLGGDLARLKRLAEAAA